MCIIFNASTSICLYILFQRDTLDVFHDNVYRVVRIKEISNRNDAIDLIQPRQPFPLIQITVQALFIILFLKDIDIYLTFFPYSCSHGLPEKILLLPHGFLTEEPIRYR